MSVLTQFSYTSAKNWRIASSAAGLVGLDAMVLLLEVDGRLVVEVVVVAPAMGSGQWRRRSLMLPPVRRQEM